MGAVVDDTCRSFIALCASRYMYTNTLLATATRAQALRSFWDGVPLCLGVAAALLVGELGGWFSHWLLHVRSLPLWQLHRVHHAVDRLYILNTYRFHPLDLALQLFC